MWLKSGCSKKCRAEFLLEVLGENLFLYFPVFRVLLTSHPLLYSIPSAVTTVFGERQLHQFMSWNYWGTRVTWGSYRDYQRSLLRTCKLYFGFSQKCLACNLLKGDGYYCGKYRQQPVKFELLTLWFLGLGETNLSYMHIVYSWVWVQEFSASLLFFNLYKF